MASVLEFLDYFPTCANCEMQTLVAGNGMIKFHGIEIREKQRILFLFLFFFFLSNFLDDFQRPVKRSKQDIFLSSREYRFSILSILSIGQEDE